MTKIRHTIDEYDVDWISGGGVEEIRPLSRQKEKLREDISRIDEMEMDDLNELDDRVFHALSNTVASIEAFREKALFSAPDDEDLDWLRRAEYSRLSFVRARKLIHNRKVLVTKLIKKREYKKEKRERKQEHKAETEKQIEIARKKQEEKTRRHQITQVNDLKVAKKVIGLIKDRGILTQDEVLQLYEDAEAILFPGSSKGDASNG